MDLAVKQNWKRTLAKIVSNSQKTSESYKTRENANDKIRERLFFGKLSENLKINRKPWGNDFGLISWKVFFWKIVGKLSVNVRDIFVFAI